MVIEDNIRQKWTLLFHVGDLTKIEDYILKHYPLYQNRKIKIPKAIKHGYGDQETINIINEYYKIK